MSDKRTRLIAEGLARLGNRTMLHQGAIISAKVTGVSSDNLVRVDFDGVEINDVQLRPLATGSNRSMVIVPKVGSIVLLGQIETDTTYCILMVEQAEKVLYKIGDIQLTLLEDKMLINGDQYKGLVKVEQLQANLDQIKTYLDTLKVAINAGISAVGAVAVDGGAGSAAFQSAMAAAIINFQDMENPNVKHG